MTEHHWSEPMPWQDEQQKQDRAVRRMLREAEIPVPADDDERGGMAVLTMALCAAVGFVLGLTAATFFGG
jgi:hypothetical protein